MSSQPLSQQSHVSICSDDDSSSDGDNSESLYMREYEAKVTSQLAAAEKKSAKRLAKKKDTMGVDSSDISSSSDDDESVYAEVIDDGEQTHECRDSMGGTGGGSFLEDLFNLEQSTKDEEAFKERHRKRRERQLFPQILVA